MLKKIAQVLVIILLLMAVAYFVACTYMNFFAAPSIPGQIKLPDAKTATYSVTVANTGTLLLTNNYETLSDTPGSRVYVLHGYWELSGQEYREHKNDITLDERVFGNITIKRRSTGSK
jgi:hypothetical protein